MRLVSDARPSAGRCMSGVTFAGSKPADCWALPGVQNQGSQDEADLVGPEGFIVMLCLLGKVTLEVPGIAATVDSLRVPHRKPRCWTSSVCWIRTVRESDSVALRVEG